jgi:hypothetical protein
VLALSGTLLAWLLARRADLKDRPRRELVPVVSRFLAAVAVIYRAKQEVHAAGPSLVVAQGQPNPDRAILEHYSKMWAEAVRDHIAGLGDARMAAAEISLLYPELENAADALLSSTDIEGIGLRSEAEDNAYQSAREALIRASSMRRCSTASSGTARSRRFC